MNTPQILKTALARRSLARFAREIVPDFELAPHTKLLIEKLEDLVAGRIRRLWVSMPPRHGKSLLSSVILPVYVQGRNPRETIITAIYGSELSEGFGRRVRNYLTDPIFQKIFADCKVSPDSTAQYRLDTLAGGAYSATGRSGVLTGRGASLSVLEDLVKDSPEASSDAICRGIIEWLQTSALTTRRRRLFTKMAAANRSPTFLRRVPIVNRESVSCWARNGAVTIAPRGGPMARAASRFHKRCHLANVAMFHCSFGYPAREGATIAAGNPTTVADGRQAEFRVVSTCAATLADE